MRQSFTRTQSFAHFTEKIEVNVPIEDGFFATPKEEKLPQLPAAQWPTDSCGL